MKVSDWIRLYPRQPVTIEPDEPVESFTACFLSHPGLRDVYIMAPEGCLQGVIHHRQLARILLSEHLPVQSRHQMMERIPGGIAEELMERDFVSAHPGEELDNVLNRMLEYRVEDMPVLDDSDRVVGNINLTDVLNAAQQGKL